MPAQTDYVLDLSDSDLDKLTDMLALPPQYGTAYPTRAWLATQARAIATLPKPVVRPSKLLPRLAVKLTESCPTPRLPPAAVLCLTHRALHPWLVRALFNLLAAEATMRCDRLRQYKGKDGDGVAELAGRVAAILGSVNALWLEEGHFNLLFGEQSGAWAGKLRRVEGGCEACVLAAVGARGELLAALRANLLGRRRGGEPRLLRVVESWMKWFGGETETLLRESEVMAKGVRRARRAVGREKREARKVCKFERAAGERGSFESRRSSRGSERAPRSKRGSRHGDHASKETHGASGSERLPEAFQAECIPETPQAAEGRESPVQEEQIADWYARSELELGSRVPGRSMHPAFQPLSACHEENTAKEGAEESMHGGYTSILECYGTNASGGVISNRGGTNLSRTINTGRKTSTAGETGIGRKSSIGRRTSWVTCTVHTSQALNHNPPPPEVPIPLLDNEARDIVEVPIYACSSIYSGTASPSTPQDHRQGAARDPAPTFWDPFAEDGGGLRRTSSQVSPRTTSVQGWI